MHPRILKNTNSIVTKATMQIPSIRFLFILCVLLVLVIGTSAAPLRLTRRSEVDSSLVHVGSENFAIHTRDVHVAGTIHARGIGSFFKGIGKKIVKGAKTAVGFVKNHV